jgi:hypothetical protein
MAWKAAAKIRTIIKRIAIFPKEQVKPENRNFVCELEPPVVFKKVSEV